MQSQQQINKANFFSRPTPRKRLVAALIFTAITALFIALWQDSANNIDIGKSLGPCGFKQVYDLPCPGCGMTTAAIAFASGRIFKAFTIQPAGAILCSILIITAFFTFLIAVFGVYFCFLERFLAKIKIRYLILGLVIIILAGWAVTLAQTMAEK